MAPAVAVSPVHSAAEGVERRKSHVPTIIPAPGAHGQRRLRGTLPSTSCKSSPTSRCSLLLAKGNTMVPAAASPPVPCLRCTECYKGGIVVSTTVFPMQYVNSTTNWSEDRCFRPLTVAGTTSAEGHQS